MNFKAEWRTKEDPTKCIHVSKYLRRAVPRARCLPLATPAACVGSPATALGVCSTHSDYIGEV